MERRLAAILAADVVGYSRLMSEDEAGTLVALQAHRAELFDPKISQYNGRTIKLMGDGALVEFPSVVDAVTFAVEVQCAMRERNAGVPEDKQILFRIGINIGDVIIEGDDIYGDGVNLAARLEGLADPGGICLRRAVHNQVRDKLDLGFEDRGEIEVKNIPRPVHAFAVVLDQRAAALVTPVEAMTVGAGRRRWPLAAAGLAGLVAAAALAWWQPWTPQREVATVEQAALALPDKPSIAVLPFDNLSDDPAQNYFADGMTEDLITDLSKLSGIFVIARNSSWAYRGKSVKVQQVAEDLGVRYVLEGSVRRESDLVRVNAQLIDALSGHHLWAERYDGNAAEVFALQDKIIRQIVDALAVKLTSEEAGQVERAETGSPRAYDAFLQGWDYYRRATETDTRESISLFERAIELDPDYGRAYAALAAAHWRISSGFWTSGGVGFQHAFDRMNENLAKAMEKPTSLAFAISAEVRAQQGRYDDAFADIDRAMALAPNDPDNHVSKAKLLNTTGRAAEAEAAARWAMRLNPQYPPGFLRVLAISLFHQERYQEALEMFERVVSRQPDVVEDYATIVSSLGHLGRTEGVDATITKYNELAVPAGYSPLTVQEMGVWWYGDIFDYDDGYREQLTEGLHKAGVREAVGTDLAFTDYRKLISKSEGEYDVDGATKIGVPTAKALHDRGVAFVDVRAAIDFAGGHVPGAINLDLWIDLANDSLSKVVGKDDEVMFGCHGKYCPYSAYASAKALMWGFTRVYYFAGGFPAWQDAGYKVEVQ
jgi:TolB-like protein/class 3 adenylate cyclase/rhodanese-related sulfurtransferase